QLVNFMKIYWLIVLCEGFRLISSIHSAEEVEQIKNWEVRDSDIFGVTYPKSGTIWLQQILILIEAKGDLTATKDENNLTRVPWIEVIGGEKKFLLEPSPRLRITHLPYSLLPAGLKQKKGKVIYVARNPKDVLVSFYHFHDFGVFLETPKDFNDFYEKFMDGQVFGSSWFEHIKAYHTHRDEMNFLYITYEEMIQDLRSVVKRICAFLEKDLTDLEIDNVVEHSRFDSMRHNNKANYRTVSDQIFNHKKGTFLRKGSVGDWKNHFTVAQSEHFDKVFKEEMKDIPLFFSWDITPKKSIIWKSDLSSQPTTPERTQNNFFH
uniref:Sulfotransferase n=1 Tax=Denticeps clupeoides TaxID=299321 RepID=A0AAY4AJW5_9TELE